MYIYIHTVHNTHCTRDTHINTLNTHSVYTFTASVRFHKRNIVSHHLQQAGRHLFTHTHTHTALALQLKGAGGDEGAAVLLHEMIPFGVSVHSLNQRNNYVRGGQIQRIWLSSHSYSTFLSLSPARFSVKTASPIPLQITTNKPSCTCSDTAGRTRRRRIRL